MLVIFKLFCHHWNWPSPSSNLVEIPRLCAPPLFCSRIVATTSNLISNDKNTHKIIPWNLLKLILSLTKQDKIFRHSPIHDNGPHKVRIAQLCGNMNSCATSNFANHFHGLVVQFSSVVSIYLVVAWVSKLKSWISAGCQMIPSHAVLEALIYVFKIHSKHIKGDKNIICSEWGYGAFIMLLPPQLWDQISKVSWNHWSLMGAQ